MKPPKTILQSIRVGEEFALMEDKQLFDSNVELEPLRLFLPKTIMVKSKSERLLSSGAIQVTVNEGQDDEYVTSATLTLDDILSEDTNPFVSNEKKAIELAMIENKSTIDVLNGVTAEIQEKVQLLESANQTLERRLQKISKKAPEKPKIYFIS